MTRTLGVFTVAGAMCSGVGAVVVHGFWATLICVALFVACLMTAMDTVEQEERELAAARAYELQLAEVQQRLLETPIRV